MIINSFEHSKLLKTMLSMMARTAKTTEVILTLIDFLAFSRETPRTVPKVRSSDTPPMIETRVLYSALLPQEYNP